MSGSARCRGFLRLAATRSCLTVPEADTVVRSRGAAARGVRRAGPRSLFCLTTLFAILGPGWPTAYAVGQPSTRRVLHLVWNDGYRLLPFGRAAVAREVTKIFAAAGVETRWQPHGHGQTSNPGPAGIRVVLMPRDSSGWGLPKHTMGVVIGKKVPRETVFVFFPNVARTLGYDPPAGRAPSPRDRARLARALGRVVAHEVVHALLPDRKHDASGLLCLHLDRRRLLQSRLSLARETQEALSTSFTATRVSGDLEGAHAVPSSRP